MTQRRRGREACFAWMNPAPVFGGQPGQVEKIDDGLAFGEYVLRDLSRKLFDISPGHVCSERDDPLTSRMRVGAAASACRCAASLIAAAAATQSIESS